MEMRIDSADVTAARMVLRVNSIPCDFIVVLCTSNAIPALSAMLTLETRMIFLLSEKFIIRCPSKRLIGYSARFFCY